MTAKPGVRKPGVRLLRYRTALLTHLGQGSHGDIMLAVGLGSGLPKVQLAEVHERILADVLAPITTKTRREDLKRQAGLFLATALLPIRRKTPPPGDERAQLVAALAQVEQCGIKLTEQREALALEIADRKSVETALSACEARHRRLQAKSERQHASQRNLSRMMLLAQEDERKALSRELHDVIAQSLTTINTQLAELRVQAVRGAEEMDSRISKTQFIVAETVEFVRQFARELRPSMLDDLGLIPALQTLMEGIATRTGLHIHLAVCPDVEELGVTRRTVLYRVAQEALKNITRHARAERVEVEVREVDNWFRMSIHDDGKAFSVEDVLHASNGQKLGLLCMRERLAMVGGRFSIRSEPALGTTVQADIPIDAMTREHRRTDPTVAPEGDRS